MFILFKFCFELPAEDDIFELLTIVYLFCRFNSVKNVRNANICLKRSPGAAANRRSIDSMIML